MASNNNNNRPSGFENIKYEVAKEVGVNLNQGYNGDISARDAGRIGGTIVKKVFAQYRNNQGM